METWLRRSQLGSQRVFRLSRSYFSIVDASEQIRQCDTAKDGSKRKRPCYGIDNAICDEGISQSRKGGLRHSSVGLAGVLDIVESGLLAKMIPAERFVTMLQVCRAFNKSLLRELAKGGSNFEVLLKGRVEVALEDVHFAPFTRGKIRLQLTTCSASSIVVAKELARTTAWGWEGPHELVLEYSGAEASNHQHTLQLLPLRCWPNLHTLDIRGVPQDDAVAWSALPPILDGCTSLRTLHMQEVRLSVPDFRRSLESVAACTGLTDLKINGTIFGDAHDGPQAVADVLRQWPALSHLDIGRAHLRSSGLLALCPVLPHCHALRSLELDPDDEVPDDVMECLARSLPRGLTRLYLSQADMDPEGADHLATLGLKRCMQLTSFEMRTNHIGSEGALGLAAALRDHSNLTRLTLRDAELGRDGSVEALEALISVQAPRLRELELSENGFGPDQVRVLAEGLRMCPELRLVDLDECQMRPAGMAHLASVLGQLPHLATLRLERNELGRDGLAELVKVLPLCSRLTELNLAGNGLDDECARMLAGALPECSRLATLHLAENEIGQAGAAALLERLDEFGMLQELCLSEPTAALDDIAPLALDQSWAQPMLSRRRWARASQAPTPWQTDAGEEPVERQGSGPTGDESEGVVERAGYTWSVAVEEEGTACDVKALMALTVFLREQNAALEARALAQ